MPRGFKGIESGANLSPRLANVKDLFLAGLKKARSDGRITATKGITGAKICEGLKRNRKIKLSGSDVRALVNYWRRNGQPIISINSGYSIALSNEELEPTLQHLEDRIRGEQAAVAGLRRAFKPLPDAIQEPLFAGENNNGR